MTATVNPASEKEKNGNEQYGAVSENFRTVFSYLWDGKRSLIIIIIKFLLKCGKTGENMIECRPSL